MLNAKKLFTKILNEITSLETVTNTVTLHAVGKDWTFRKIGPFVYLDAPGDSTGVVAGNNTIGTLPEGMRPISNIRQFSGNLYNVNCVIVLDTTGLVRLYSATASAAARNCAFALSYIAA